MAALSIILLVFFAASAYAIASHFKLKKLSLARGDANICEYARSFDYRVVDTRIMREIWNEVQKALGNPNGKPFPIKADDLLEETYNIDPDDLDDIYWKIADRLGIDTQNPEENPLFNKVTSVRNLVMFLHYQSQVHHA
ncbi:hypothetical protein ACNFCK_20780 [Pseudomonas sp. NY15366]